MSHPTKAVTSKPVGNNFYTITYKENGKTQTMNVEKGIEVFGNKDCKTNFKAPGNSNVTLNITPEQAAVLKSFAGADHKPTLSKEDVSIMYSKEKDGVLGGYINSKTPEGVKFDSDSMTFNYINTMSVEVDNNKTKKHFSVTVNAPGHEKNAPAG